MSNVLDKARQHYESLGRHEIDVPEWDTVIYYHPMTLAVKDKIFRHTDKGNSNFAMFAYAIIFMAEDKAGEAMFTLEDRKALMTECDQDVITRIGKALFATDDPNL